MTPPNGEAIAFVLACPTRAGKGFCLGQDFVELRFEPGQDGRGRGQVARAAHFLQFSGQCAGHFQPEGPHDALDRVGAAPQKDRVGRRHGGPRLVQ